MHTFQFAGRNVSVAAVFGKQSAAKCIEFPHDSVIPLSVHIQEKLKDLSKNVYKIFTVALFKIVKKWKKFQNIHEMMNQ